MKRISKSALKARMLQHFRRVEETGEELIVTDRDRPVLRILPFRHRTPAAESFAGVQGKVVYHGDLLAPTGEEWPET